MSVQFGQWFKKRNLNFIKFEEFDSLKYFF